MSRHVLRPAARAAMRGSKGQNAANGLLNNLIAYWPGNEANGNALDLHTNGLTLTDNNTVTSAAGLVYAGARQYTAANGEWHSRETSALLQTGDIEWTMATWCNLDSKAANRSLICKYINSDGRRGYIAKYEAASDRFVFYLYNGTERIGEVSATSLGSPSVATWYLISFWHDPTANTVNIQVNNGTVDSAATTGPGGVSNLNTFCIGSLVNSNFETWSGRVGPTAFWKSAGAGGVLTAGQRTALYNGGAGLPYAAFTL